MGNEKNQAALDYHATPAPGKVSVIPTKPCVTQQDLAMAYTPGVAVPCLEIKARPEDVWKYTAKGQHGRRSQRRDRRARSG